MVLGYNLIERVQYIADEVEKYLLDQRDTEQRNEIES
jgi:hypothetical protein